MNARESLPMTTALAIPDNILTEASPSNQATAGMASRKSVNVGIMNKPLKSNSRTFKRGKSNANDLLDNL